MAVGYFYTDLDGTLLQDKGPRKKRSISKANLAALRAFQQKGGQVGVATGRLLNQAMTYARRIKADLPVISANGAVIQSMKGKVLRLLAITSREAIKGLCQRIQGQSCRRIYTAYIHTKTYKLRFVPGVCRPPGKGEGIIKLRLRRCPRHKELYKALRQQYGGRFQVIESGTGKYRGISIAAKGVGKGAALRYVSKKLGFSLKETAFIGDSGNDISGVQMIQRHGGRCFVVRNGTGPLKAACPHHTKADYMHDAVAEALRRLMPRP